MRRHPRKLVAKVSFDANKEHKLQEGGVKISADFKVDPKNELYASLPGEGTAKEFPFAEISIKHLNLQDGTNKAPLVKVTDYKDNLQLNVDEHIQLQGFRIAGALASAWPTDIYVTANAKLDLANAENNGTELYAALKIGHLDTKYKEEYLYGAGMPLELSYKAGTLTVRTDAGALLLDASGAAAISAYDMLLSGPIGNLVDGLLTGTAKEQFDDLYWATAPDEKGEGGKFNSNFQGLVVKNLTVKSIIDMIGNAINKPTEPEKNTAGTSAEEAKANYYNTIVYALTLFSGENAGKVSITSKDGILGTVAKFAQLLALGKLTTTEEQPAEDPEGEPTTVTTTYDWNKEGIINWAVALIDPLIKGFTGGMLGGKDLLAFDGVSGETFAEVLNNVLEENPDAIKVALDFTKGFNWDITLGMHKDPEIALKWTSRIGFGDAIPVQNIRDRIAAEKAELEKQISTLKETNDTTNAAQNAAKTKYNETQQYKDMTSAQDAVKAKRTLFAQDSKNAEYFAEILRPGKGGASGYLSGSVQGFPIFDYLLARYTYESDPNDDLKAEMDGYYTQIIDAFVIPGYDGKTTLADGKGRSDIDACFDKVFALYKEQIGAEAKAYSDALKVAQATPEYADYHEKLEAYNRANWEYTYASARLEAYTRYEGNYDELKKAYDDALALDKAYEAALAAIDEAIGEDTNKAAFTTALTDYLHYYAGSKQASDQYASVVASKKSALDTAKANLTNAAQVTEEMIAAVAEAYEKAYTVNLMNFGMGDPYFMGEKKNSDAPKTALDGAYAWVELDLAPAKA